MDAGPGDWDEGQIEGQLRGEHCPEESGDKLCDRPLPTILVDATSIPPPMTARGTHLQVDDHFRKLGDKSINLC